MQTIRLLKCIQIGGEPHLAGDIVIASEKEARYAISVGQAEACEAPPGVNPRPLGTEEAGALIDLSIAKAIPGGKRPGRRRSR